MEEKQPSPSKTPAPTPEAPAPPANPVPPPAATAMSAPQMETAPGSDMIHSIERVTVWIMVLSAIMFAIIGIMAIWGVIGQGSEIVGRSLATIAVIAFTALVINIGARLLESRKK